MIETPTETSFNPGNRKTYFTPNDKVILFPYPTACTGQEEEEGNYYISPKLFQFQMLREQLPKDLGQQ